MPTPTATEIIARVKARYAGCRTYEDEGTVATTLVTAVHGRHPMLGIFRTCAERPFTGPIRFAFEFASQTTNKPESLDFRVWTHLSSVYRSVGGRIDEVNSVDGAFGSVLHVTGFTSHIAGLLSRADAGFIDAETATLRSSEIDGVPHEVLAGRLHDHQITVWIETATQLLVRVDRIMEMPGFIVEEQTTWTPRTDHAIDPQVFELCRRNERATMRA